MNRSMLKELRKLSNREAVGKVIACFFIACLLGGICFLFNTLRPTSIKLNEVEFDEIKDKHVETDINLIVDCFGSHEEYGIVTAKYYIIPVGEQSYMAMEVPNDYFDEFDKILKSSKEYMMGKSNAIEGSVTATGFISGIYGDELKSYQEYCAKHGFDEKQFLPYIFEIPDLLMGKSGGKFFVIPDLPMYVTVAMYLFSMIFIAAIVVMSVIIIKMLSGSYLKMLTGYCKKTMDYAFTLHEIEQFYRSTKPIENIWISEKYVMFLKGSEIIFFEAKDLLWAYMDVDHQYTYLIKTGTFHSICFCTRDGKRYRVRMTNEEAVQETLGGINIILPFVFIDYSKELDHLYRKNRTELIVESEKIRTNLIDNL